VGSSASKCFATYVDVVWHSKCCINMFHISVLAYTARGGGGVSHPVVAQAISDSGDVCLASHCCLHTHTSRKSTPLCRIVMTALDPAARARPDRAILGWCGSRAGVRRARRLDVNPSSLWTAARWQSIYWMSARERCTPARRRLCATPALFPDQDASPRPASSYGPAQGNHVEHTRGVDGGRPGIPYAIENRPVAQA
jgi:hypothetical protein